MKKSKSYSFPAHDSRTSRLESIAFTGLGLAGAVLIAQATTNALRFAQNREAIIQAWSAPGPTRIERSRHVMEQTLTNSPGVHATTGRMNIDAPPGTRASARSQVPTPQWQIAMDRATH
jgi:hypothetical protein